MAQRGTDPAAIEAKFDRIRSLGLDALRQRWGAMFGAAPPAGLTKDITARMIAYRIQEEVFGGLDRNTIMLLNRFTRGEKIGGELDRRLKPGTVLFREYQGERYTVTVVPEGFLWRGTTYSSLSTIAHAITGTVWNGPRFFGLRTNSRSADPPSRRASTASIDDRRDRTPQSKSVRARKEVRT